MVKNVTMKKYITERERAVIGRLSYEKTDIITRKLFDSYFSSYSGGVRDKLVSRLIKKSILLPVKKGLYIYSPLEYGQTGRAINEFIIPGYLFPDDSYYIGYNTMYSYYGFTEQLFGVVYVLNTSLQRDRAAGGVRYKLVKVPAKRMYGITRIKAGAVEARVSDIERTLVDLLYYPAPVGGLPAAYEIMAENIRNKKVDLGKFIRYLKMFPSAYVKKRAGYMLEKYGYKTGSLIKSVNPRSIMSLYDNKSRKGVFDKKWGVIVNDTQG